MMEVIVALVGLIYHDVGSIGLELDVAGAVKFYVLHHIGKGVKIFLFRMYFTSLICRMNLVSKGITSI